MQYYCSEFDFLDALEDTSLLGKSISSARHRLACTLSTDTQWKARHVTDDLISEGINAWFARARDDYLISCSTPELKKADLIAAYGNVCVSAFASDCRVVAWCLDPPEQSEEWQAKRIKSGL